MSVFDKPELKVIISKTSSKCACHSASLLVTLSSVNCEDNKLILLL